MLPLRARLTVWYSGVLALSFCAVGLAAWLGMRESLLAAIDADLQERLVEAERQFGAQTDQDVAQVRADTGEWMFRSEFARREDVPLEPLRAAAVPRVNTLDAGGKPYRSAVAAIARDGHTYTLQIMEPLRGMTEALRRFGEMLLMVMPAMLFAAAAGGYWISRRALGPVDRIAANARAITAHSLSMRLEVPETDDELRRLSETLNSMLGRLEESFVRIRDFTADASHELRTPITFMQTVADITLRQTRTEPEYREALQQIRGELRRTAVLIDDLLTLARADAAASLPSREPVDLMVVVAAASAGVSPIAEQKGVRLNAQPGGPVVTSGDRDLLHRLVVILLDNAVKYTPAGGCIDVSVSAADGRARIAVRDTGIGIAAEEGQRIFDRFYRADKARSRENGGVGLGLAIGRSIAEAHGGTLSMVSTPGHGSTFTVALPLWS